MFGAYENLEAFLGLAYNMSSHIVLSGNAEPADDLTVGFVSPKTWIGF